MRWFFFLWWVCTLSGCTYSVVVSGNLGSGVDSVEETDTTDPVITTTPSFKEGV